ncbi:EAL domain-containing protein [Pontibacillus sp. ALD_SL1]|uniref:EAL domain-containing protein n=1 Tax=Pontibacillus sp. ALD_SL1 TaxID=2777185 RepID=UPI001A97AEBA|nr:EAL domain-containing protein [Pontibacillus sp. ALD_SL1]QST01374.1 EAL domain-containing protein [Pontibacillus sp. ALD_SL1]
MSNPCDHSSLPIHKKLLDHLQDALLFVDEGGEIVEWNQPAKDLLNISVVQPTSIYSYFDFDQLIVDEDVQRLMKVVDGSGRQLSVKVLGLNCDNKKLYCLTLQDSSFYDRIKELRQQIGQFMDSSLEGMVLHDNGVIVECDDTFAEILGYESEELLHKSVFDIVDPQYSRTLKEKIDIIPNKPYEIAAVTKSGKRIHLEVMAHPYPYDNKILRGAVIRDITERVENEQRIEFMAYFDELTNLPNRTYFLQELMDVINQAQTSGEMFAVYFMDIDYFKQINDTMGYVFGDKLLQSCARRLKYLQNEHTFLARMGGDEFLILQRYVKTKEEAEALAQEIINQFQEPIHIDDFELFTSVSIGISLYPDDGQDANELIKHADSAMNVIKEHYRNDYKMFESSISKDFKTILTMETELRKALKEGQFELHYQPQKNIVTGRIVGVEALLRWNHPKEGFISPGTFIPLAEKTGLILEIGDWVMYEACRQNKQWQDEGYDPIIVGVNLSAKQFHQSDLVERVALILNKTGLHPSHLELEITESMAMSNEEDIIQTLEGLRDLGVYVSIDDFGTGYSSLKYLSRFPVNKLKIDKVFIQNRKQNEAIVKSIIHMSHSLDMKVIAEGVETEEQLTFLKNERCDEMQGFFYSKPLPPTDLNEMFQKQTV